LLLLPAAAAAAVLASTAGFWVASAVLLLTLEAPAAAAAVDAPAAAVDAPAAARIDLSPPAGSCLVAGLSENEGLNSGAAALSCRRPQQQHCRADGGMEGKSSPQYLVNIRAYDQCAPAVEVCTCPLFPTPWVICIIGL
jgi:hypothetical protein